MESSGSSSTRPTPSPTSAQRGTRCWPWAPPAVSPSPSRYRFWKRSLEEPRTTALFLYPTKALAQDQLRSLRAFDIGTVSAAIYDGDTPKEERPELRRHTNVILTNPDMLHVGILPSHDRWADFFHRLEFVVVDEVHNLRGVFGTHVAFIIRRLRRLCQLYGADPTFVLASATIGNPAELAAQLTGLEVEVVAGDYSPTGKRSFVLWNPELTDVDLGIRRSALGDATEVFAHLINEGGRVIAFARGRKSTELMFKWAGSRLPPNYQSPPIEPATPRNNVAR